MMIFDRDHAINSPADAFFSDWQRGLFVACKNRANWTKGNKPKAGMQRGMHLLDAVIMLCSICQEEQRNSVLLTTNSFPTQMSQNLFDDTSGITGNAIAVL